MHTRMVALLPLAFGVAHGQIAPITEPPSGQPYRGTLSDDANADDSST